MLTRSYLIDITLVALASFTLVCVLGRTDGQPAGELARRHAFAVEIEQADGRKTTYRVNETRQTADQLRADVVQRMIGRRSPDVAWMQWFQETAERYAATCSHPAVAAAHQSDAESVLHTVSTGSEPNVNRHRETKEDGDANGQILRWRDFWTQRQAKATLWLANYEQHDQARRSALNASIQITPIQTWLPSPAACVKALLVATLVVLLGMVWRLLCPVRSCRLGGGASMASKMAAAEDKNTAAMCFRESWVRVRQPASVVLRGIAGWSIVLSSLIACVSLVIRSLVS